MIVLDPLRNEFDNYVFMVLRLLKVDFQLGIPELLFSLQVFMNYTFALDYHIGIAEVLSRPDRERYSRILLYLLDLARSLLEDVFF
jgi:hypothetical protein